MSVTFLYSFFLLGLIHPHFFTYLKVGNILTKTKTFLQVGAKITQCLQESCYHYDPRAIHFSSVRFCQILNLDELN